jgi:tRNA(Ile)-lysidine synthase
LPIELTNRILATIARHQMLRAGDRVGVGVSGGSDSVALLRILRELSDQLGIRLMVLHFNHCLRGMDSEQDEQFVAALASEQNLPFFSGREDVAAVARAKRWNLEDAARRLRYGFFRSLIGEGHIDRVAVAHTSDDQAETVLSRLLRGTGPSGLAAIYPVKGHVVRPLLEIRRTELREYLESHGQPWREDATNHDPARLRSRLRHRILPILEGELQPAIVSHLGRLAGMARQDEAFWGALIGAQVASLLRRDADGLSIRCTDLLVGALSPGVEFPKEAQSAVAQRLVRGIVEELRGDCRQWTADHVERVIELATGGSSGSRLQLPGVLVERNFDWLSFSLETHGVGRQARERSRKNSPASSAFSRLVELGNLGESTTIAVPEIRCRFHLKVVDWHPGGSDTYSDQGALDRDLLDSPLVLRNWRPGDSFRPQGRRGARKLKQFLRMERVALRDRQGWPVLTSANMLVWARGLSVAADFAPGSATRTGVVITEEKL